MSETKRLVVLFFGCWDKHRTGHYLVNTDGSLVNDDYRQKEMGGCPLSANQLDGVFAPRTAVYEDETQTAVTHVHGWTVLAMWDRSADSRHASNAAFLAPGRCDEATMWTLAERAYPQIVQRLVAGANWKNLRERLPDDPRRPPPRPAR